MLMPAYCSALELSKYIYYLDLSQLDDGSIGGFLIYPIPETFTVFLAFYLIVIFIGLSYDPPVEEVLIFFEGY